jgi:hypothetical protein
MCLNNHGRNRKEGCASDSAVCMDPSYAENNAFLNPIRAVVQTRFKCFTKIKQAYQFRKAAAYECHTTVRGV